MIRISKTGGPLNNGFFRINMFKRALISHLSIADEDEDRDVRQNKSGSGSEWSWY